MVTVDSLTFDLSDCSLKQNGETHREWLNSNSVAHLLRFNEGRVSWKFDLRDIDAAREFYGQQCKDNGGVMLSLDVISAARAEALKGLFKYRAPNGRSGMLIVGILWMPFENCNFQINVEALETGTIAMRETAIMLKEPDSWPKNDQPPIKVDSAEELFARMRAAPVVALPSDDERYDQSFPDHPLSKVRARLKNIIETITLDPNVSSLKPYRVG